MGILPHFLAASALFMIDLPCVQKNWIFPLKDVRLTTPSTTIRRPLLYYVRGGGERRVDLISGQGLDISSIKNVTAKGWQSQSRDSS